MTPARALALTVHALVALSLAACASGAASTGPPSPTAPPSPALPTLTPSATIALPPLIGVTSDGSAFWLLTSSGGLARLDPATNAVGAARTVAAGLPGGGLAADPHAFWLTDFDGSLVRRIDRRSFRVVATIPVGKNPGGIAVDTQHRAVWVADHRGGTVDRIDPATNRVVASVKVGSSGPSGPSGVGLGLGSVWVGVPNASRYFRIDPRTNRVVATVDVPFGGSPCGGFTFSTLAVWTPSCQDTTKLVRIDPVTNTAVAIELGGYGSDPVLVEGFPWLVVESLSGQPARLVRVSPTTNAVDRVVSLGDGFKEGGIALLGGAVWVFDSGRGQVLRLPLTALAS